MVYNIEQGLRFWHYLHSSSIVTEYYSWFDFIFQQRISFRIKL